MQIKVCGITRLDDALAAVDAGADMLGYNFYAGSKRYVAPATCARIVAALRQAGRRAVHVGVFVNAPAATIAMTCADCGLDMVQLSGDETTDLLAGLGVPAFKAIRPASLAAGVRDAARYGRSGQAPALLVDAYQPGAYGGTGHTGDWAVARQLAMRWDLMLAGGLTPANVAAAVRAVQPWGVDVASGVESAPGHKDPALMAAFVAGARSGARDAAAGGRREGGEEP